MNTITVEIFAGAVRIGSAQVAARDYGMAVAGGGFQAEDAYSASEHAALIEGVRSVRPAIPLEARMMDGRKVVCDLVTVTDYAASVGSEGREVDLFGVDLVRYFGPAPCA